MAWLRVLRRVVQALALVIFLMLIVHAGELAARIGTGAAILPRLSPLGAIGSATAGTPLAEVLRLYWPALALVAATILAGRFFCGWLCPLGTVIDLADRALKAARTRRMRATAGRSSLYDGRRLKYYLLAALVVAALLGVQLIGWFDPLSIAPRTFITVGYPSFAYLIDSALSGVQAHVPGLSEPVQAVRVGADAAFRTLAAPAFQGHLFILLVFGVLAGFGLAARRYWCRNLCPLGALLALVSGWSLLKRKVSDGCTSCGKCVEACGMGAIAAGGKRSRAGECTACFTCAAVCPAKAVGFGHAARSGQRQPVDLSRRNVLAALVAGIAAVPLLKLSVARKTGAAAGGQVPVIRPPGALPEDEFLERCTRCGECLQVCKTNGLQPAALQAGLDGLWTPHLVPRIGYCDRNCTLCGHVCPSQAIRALSLDEKNGIAIGRAVINRSACLPWIGWAMAEAEPAPAIPLGQAGQPGLPPAGRRDYNCAVCEEVCPVPGKAIRFNVYRTVDVIGGGGPIEIRRPYVIEDYCTGCGFCEKVCPVGGDSAITIRPERGKAVLPPGAPAPSEAGARLLPGAAAGLKRANRPLRYSPANLTELIDGDAPRYLTYALVQVYAARYVLPRGDTVRVEVWEFDDAAEAFGVYRMDSAGLEPLKGIGDEAGKAMNMIWGRKGSCYFRTGSSRIEADKVVELVRAIAGGLPRGGGGEPALVRQLPEHDRLPGSERYLHQWLNLKREATLGPGAEENVFGLSRQTNVALADYSSGGGRATSLMVIEYPGAAPAMANLAALCRKIGRDVVEAEMISYRTANGGFGAAAAKGRCVVAAFRSPDPDKAKALVQETIDRLDGK